MDQFKRVNGKLVPMTAPEIEAQAERDQLQVIIPEDRIAEKYAQIEADRDDGLIDVDATVDVAGVIFQANPSSMAALNEALTVFMALGGTPDGYEWRDAENTNHAADLTLLASIAAARAKQVNQIWKTSWARKAALELVDPAAEGALEKITAI